MAHTTTFQMESGVCMATSRIHYHNRQQEYYKAINASNDAGESTVFIEFMLSAIKASLTEAIRTSDEMSDEKMDKATLRWNKIETYLKSHDYIMNADVRKLCGV